MPRCSGATIAGAQQVVKCTGGPQQVRSMALLASVFSLLYMNPEKISYVICQTQGRCSLDLASRAYREPSMSSLLQGKGSMSRCKTRAIEGQIAALQSQLTTETPGAAINPASLWTGKVAPSSMAQKTPSLSAE